MKKFLQIITLLIAVSCDSMPKDWEWGMRPRPFNGLSGFPSTKTEYGAGFKEGCSVGWSTVNKGMMSDFMPGKLSPKRITQSSDFRTGWWDGFEQCVYVSDWDVI